jgi:hypothetical protein
MVAAEAEKWRGVGGEPWKKDFMTIEAGICMKTNKTTTICPAKKRHFCKTERHFTQKHTFLAEIDGFLSFLERVAQSLCVSDSAVLYLKNIRMLLMPD